MYEYSIYGITIHSDIRLNLQPAKSLLPGYTILSRDVPISEVGVEWLHDFEIEDGLPWFRLGTVGSYYLLRFIDYADFLIDEKSRVVFCTPVPGTQTNTIEHLLLDQVIPRVLSRGDDLVLHAGAVCGKTGAIGFLGKTGSGKSTLTTFLGQNGYSIMSDDCLVLKSRNDSLTAVPGYPSVRLNPDMTILLGGDESSLCKVAEYTNKMRFPSQPDSSMFSGRPETLATLFFMDNSNGNRETEDVAIESCSKVSGFRKIISNTFRLDPTSIACNKKDFHLTSKLIANTPIYSLTFPHRDQALRDVLELLANF